MSTKNFVSNGDAETLFTGIGNKLSTLKSGLTNLDSEVNGDAVEYPYADVITIPDAVPSNLADCTVKIEPVQDLHGQSVPYVGGAGKNKLHTTATTTTKDDVTYTVNSDGTISLSGTASGVAGLTITTDTVVDNTKTYILSGLEESNNIVWNNAVLLDNNQTQLKTYSLVGRNDITFDDFNKYPTAKYLQVGIKRYQNGVVSGIIKPMLRLATETDATFVPYTNICPISGHTEASVQRDGKNLFDGVSVLSANLNNSGVISNESINNRLIYTPCKANTTYTVSKKAGSSFRVAYCNSIPTFGTQCSGLITDNTASSITITTGNSAGYIVAWIWNSADTTGVSDMIASVQVELGSTATPYVPYVEPKTYTIALGDTIYGGTVNFNTGVMTVTHGYFIIDSTSDFTKNTSEWPSNMFITVNSTVGVQDGAIVSNKYKRISSQSSAIGCYISANNRIRINTLGTYASVQEAFNGELENTTFVYPLATPITVQLTPQQIQLLKGQNTITASTGQISVTVNGVSGAIGSVQEQVNEIAEEVNDHEERIEAVESGVTDYTDIISVTADGVKTYSELIKDLYRYVSGKCMLVVNNIYYQFVQKSTYHVFFTSSAYYSGVTSLYNIDMQSNIVSYIKTDIASDGTITVNDRSSDVPAEGVIIKLVR